MQTIEAEKVAAVAEMRAQLGVLHQMKKEEEGALRTALERERVEKTEHAAAMAARLREAEADREADATHLQTKIERLRSLHNAALAAGSVRGRQILYTESLKSPALLRNSSLTWRGEDWSPRATPARSPSRDGAFSSPRGGSPISGRRSPSALPSHRLSHVPSRSSSSGRFGAMESP